VDVSVLVRVDIPEVLVVSCAVYNNESMVSTLSLCLYLINQAVVGNKKLSLAPAPLPSVTACHYVKSQALGVSLHAATTPRSATACGWMSASLTPYAVARHEMVPNDLTKSAVVASGHTRLPVVT
jgi:hypothetical protein